LEQQRLVNSFSKRTWAWLAETPHNRIGIRCLGAAIGLMLLFRLGTEAPFASFLWGPNGIGRGSTAYVVGPFIGSILDSAFSSELGTRLVLLVLGCGALLLVFGRATRFAAAACLTTFFMIEQRLPELPDGGDNITRIVLAYLLFVLPLNARARNGSLSVWRHNIAFLAIGTQTAVLYFTSGAMKMYGDKWQHGVAMYYVSQVEWFSIPEYRNIYKIPIIVSLVSYLVMAYQVWFPIAILSKLRLLWLIFGICFHVGIAFFMGLITFSTVMIGLDLALISDHEYYYFISSMQKLEYTGRRCFSLLFPNHRRNDAAH
jgi:hypothetical protein